MNAIFSTILTLSIFILTFKNPNLILSSVNNGALNAINLTVKMLAIYIFWLSINEILKELNITKFIAKLLKPIISPLFKTKNSQTLEHLSNSISANMLGLGGIATLESIECMKLFEEQKNEFGKTMLFVVSATSLQLLPISVLSLLSDLGKTNASVIILPTLICTFISTFIGILLCLVFK